MQIKTKKYALQIEISCDFFFVPLHGRGNNVLSFALMQMRYSSPLT